MQANELHSIVGFELMEDEIKSKLNLSPELQKDIQKWVDRYVGNQNTYGVKTCCVEILPLNKTLETFKEELGEDDDDPVGLALKEYKSYLRKLKVNEAQCPHFKTCPFFQNKMIVEGMKCPLELADASKHIQGYYNELEIEEDNFTDMVVTNQLVATTLLVKRALKSLAVEPIVKEVKVINKDGSIRYDTKINDNLVAYEKSMALSEKLRKNLVLNKEDRLKYKQIEEERDARSIRNKLSNDLNKIDEIIDVKSIVEEAMTTDDVFNING